MKIHIPNSMDLTALSVRVQTSRLLMENEKMYWLQHLPRMTPEQIAKLENVLSQAENLKWSATIPDYHTAQTHLSVPA